jgi:competence protein ComGC
MKRTHFGRLHGGYTLIEMMIDSIIWLFLACLLIPVFSQAREKARETTCRAHLKQLSQGFARYQADHDGKLPAPKAWRMALMPYVKDADTFECPASKHVYIYEQGRGGVLLRDKTPCHRRRRAALFNNGTMRLLPVPVPAPAPTPRPTIQLTRR